MGKTDQSQRGAAAVEFALLAPLFIALLFAIVEFGLIVYTKSMLAHASREAARLGVVYSTPRRTEAEIKAVVQNYLNQCNLTSTANVLVNWVTDSTGKKLDVTVDYTYRFFVLPQDMNRFFGGSLPSTLNLQADTVMRMEEQ